jgi:hypothetical protein
MNESGIVRITNLSMPRTMVGLSLLPQQTVGVISKGILGEIVSTSDRDEGTTKIPHSVSPTDFPDGLRKGSGLRKMI